MQGKTPPAGQRAASRRVWVLQVTWGQACAEWHMRYDSHRSCAVLRALACPVQSSAQTWRMAHGVWLCAAYLWCKGLWAPLQDALPLRHDCVLVLWLVDAVQAGAAIAVDACTVVTQSGGLVARAIMLQKGWWCVAAVWLYTAQAAWALQFPSPQQRLIYSNQPAKDADVQV
jgi:hypothetical protein